MKRFGKSILAVGCCMLVLSAFGIGLSKLGAADATTRPAGNDPTPEVSIAPAEPASEPVRIETWQASVLGVVEGLTEYLPVSSTGHLILVGDWLGLNAPPEGSKPGTRSFVESPAVSSFEVVIQLGAILAVLGLYRKRVGQMMRGLVATSRRDRADAMTDENRRGVHLFTLLIVAFLPAAVVGLLAHEHIEKHLFGPVPVIYALAVGGVLMIVIEYFFWIRRKGERRLSQVDQVRYWQALVIGCAQCLAMWPGTSRSMVTIIAALVVGLDMVAAAEFSFLLALPTLGAATVYSGLKYHNELMQSAGVVGLLVGLVVSGIVAAVAVKLFVRWLTRHGLIPFGVYRIILAGGLLAYYVW